MSNPTWVSAVQAGEHQKWLEKNYQQRPDHAAGGTAPKGTMS
jgi:hypothetical protein